MHSRFLSSFFLLALLILLCGFAAGKNAWKNPDTGILAGKKGEKLPATLSSSSDPTEEEKGDYPFAETLLNELDAQEIAAAKYYRLLDEEGKIITVTGRRIRIGDRYLDEKNRLYEVYRVKDYVATARYIRTEKLGRVKPGSPAPGFLSKLEKNFSYLVQMAITLPQKRGPGKEEESRKLIALYHTHNDESYVPSDGTHSIYGSGGIHQVGASLKAALEQKNINVIHSENLHLPHDRGAYRRSRDTALELLQRNPDVIFDIHRDAAPSDAYAAKIDDQWVTKIQFVVGRQNPSSVVTRRFAYDMKSLADDIYPGLVKGIFMGWGNYNQDLTPLNLLLEVGGHQNSRRAAEESMALFADVVAKYFYGIPVGEEGETFPGAERRAAGAGAWGAVVVILLLVAAALGVFYFLNNPAAWERFKEQTNNYLGRNGFVWKEGYHNLVLTGKKIMAGLRAIVLYTLILWQLISAFFSRVRRKL